MLDQTGSSAQIDPSVWMLQIVGKPDVTNNDICVLNEWIKSIKGS